MEADVKMRPGLLAASLLLATTLANAQTPAVPTEPVVVVSGEGVVKAAPDRAFAAFSVENRSKDPKEAQAQNAKAMTAVQSRLAAAGLPKDAVRTLSYDLNLESEWVNGRQIPKGYVARNTIEVRLDEIARVGEIIDIAITSGANAVHGVRFDLKERDALEREALKRATADAGSGGRRSRRVDRTRRTHRGAVAQLPGPADGDDARGGARRARPGHDPRGGRRDRDPVERRADRVVEVARAFCLDPPASFAAFAAAIGGSDRLRHRYQAATERYGRQASAICNSVLRVGRWRSP
jgi:hypothetical protein